jgi:hypothetical protein
MAVKMYHGDGPICAVDGTQQWESNCVVAAERDDARQCSPILGWARLFGIRFWWS